MVTRLWGSDTMIEPMLGLVGSPVDLATFVYLVVHVHRHGRRQDRNDSATVALADETDGVDEDHVRRDLDADQDHVTLLTDGGDP